MTLAARFCSSSGRATQGECEAFVRPSRRRCKIAKPRLQHNPAGIHLVSAGHCPNAYSDEAGHAFQLEAGHLFRSEAGRHSDLMSATGVALPQINADDVSRFARGQGRSVFADEERRLRRLSPESSIR